MQIICYFNQMEYNQTIVIIDDNNKKQKIKIPLTDVYDYVFNYCHSHNLSTIYCQSENKDFLNTVIKHLHLHDKNNEFNIEVLE